MSIFNALNGLIADALDRLAERISRTPAHQEATRSRLTEFLDDPGRDGGRALVAKMARAEVKNYLATICEAAGVPFTSPEQVLSAVLQDLAQKEPPQ